MKHTKGPWKTIEIGSKLYIGPGVTDVVCELLTQQSDKEANARLVTAAPEMYALLHALWAKMDPENRDCKRISTLLDKIDKAE